jgi:hypothetical protein
MSLKLFSGTYHRKGEVSFIDPTPWWSNIVDHVYDSCTEEMYDMEQSYKVIGEIIESHGGVMVKKERLFEVTFEDEKDATAFLLRWS